MFCWMVWILMQPANRYLVADPDQGELRTLQDVFDRRDITANASNITEKYILG